MIRTLRHIGIAIGSIVIAWLAVSLVAGVVLGPNASRVLIVLIALALGGLIYQDIVRRERRPV